MKSPTRNQWLLLLLGAGAVLAAASAWLRLRTESAEANPAAPLRQGASCHAHVRAEGRVVNYPGARVEVGSEMAGLIVRLPVEENQPVEKGVLIAELKADELKAALAEAQARVKELEAEQRLAEHDLERNRQLLDTGAISRQECEHTTRDQEVIRARHQSALATVARLEATLAKTRIVAPIRGVVLRRHVEAGETIEANTQVATLADLSRARVEAEVDEFDAARVKVGQAVRITAEGFPGRTWQGRVEEVPAVVVDKGLLPRDPARSIDVRVLLAKIAFQEPTPLKLGQRVEVDIAGD